MILSTKQVLKVIEDLGEPIHDLCDQVLRASDLYSLKSEAMFPFASPAVTVTMRDGGWISINALYTLFWSRKSPSTLS